MRCSPCCAFVGEDPNIPDDKLDEALTKVAS